MTFTVTNQQFETLCTECVNMNRGFSDNEFIEKHSCEAFAVCGDCKEAKQVSTYRTGVKS